MDKHFSGIVSYSLPQRLAHRYLQRLRVVVGIYLSGDGGELRVCNDTLVVTYYNAPNVEALRRHYENLPQKLQAEGVDPRIPWLYNFRLDFRFA